MYRQHHKQLQIRRVQTRLLQTHTHQVIQDTDEKQAQLKALSCQRERLLPKANQVWEVTEYRRPPRLRERLQQASYLSLQPPPCGSFADVDVSRSSRSTPKLARASGRPGSEGSVSSPRIRAPWRGQAAFGAIPPVSMAIGRAVRRAGAFRRRCQVWRRRTRPCAPIRP